MPRALKISLFILLGLVVLVLAGLPVVNHLWANRIQKNWNDQLADVGQYSGRMDDVSLSVATGVLTLTNFRLEKRNASVEKPFLKIPEVRLDMTLPSLFRAKTVGQMHWERPEMHFIRARRAEEQQLTISIRWYNLVKNLLPFRLREFQVSDGEIHFHDRVADPSVDLRVTALSLRAKNLRNIEPEGESASPARVTADGRAMENGRFRLNAQFDPLVATPPFDLHIAFKNVHLDRINDWLRAHTNLDVEAGVLDLTADFHGKDGEVDGTIVPEIRGLSLLDLSDPPENPLNFLWQGLVETAANLAESGEENVIHAEIPVSGDYGESELGTVLAIGGVLTQSVAGAFQEVLTAPAEVFTAGAYPDD